MDRLSFLRFVLPAVGLVSMSACSSTIIVSECNEDEASCDGDCTILATDPANCGACGHECDGGVCVDGQCAGACAPPDVACDGTCVDTTKDPHHCGSCEVDCDGMLCQTGHCVTQCDPGFIACSGSCVDTSSDPDNCGGCGIPCDTVCSFGECAQACPPNTTECFGACVDTTSDPQNCGGCGIPCSFNEACIASQCQGGRCPPGFTDCFGECVDTSSDPDNCGGCGIPCAPFQVCQDHQCIGNPTCSDNVCGICDYVFIPSDPNFQVTGSTDFAANNHVPECTGFDEAPEVLHVFTPQVSGNYTIDAIGSSYDTTLEVMNGSCQVLQCNDDTVDLDPVIQMDLQAGQTYYIVLDGFASGSYAINVHEGAVCPPGLTFCDGDCVDTQSDPNNCNGCGIQCGFDETCEFGFCQSECFGPCGTCADPVFLASQVPQTFQGNTTGADAVLFASCGFADGPEVLHYFQAPVTGNYVFSTANSGFDTVLSLLDAFSCGELACNDDFGGQFTSRISAALTQGQEVYIAVDGNSGQSGFYNLSITGAAQATCPTSALGNMLPLTVSGNTFGASNGYAPNCTSSQAPEHTFTFTAPTTKLYAIDTFGSTFDTALYVLNAQCTGQQIACNDDVNGTLQSQLFVNLTAGQTVTVVVDGYGSNTGSYVLHIQ